MNCIVIDMDGSLVNLDKTLLTRVSEVLKFDFTKVDGKIFSYEEMITKYIPVTKQQVMNTMTSIWSENGFWKALPPYPGSIEAINELSKEYKIVVCTRIPPASTNAFPEKESWVIGHFPKIQVEFFAVSNGAKKTRIDCEYIIEDRLKEIQDCPNKTTAIILNRTWNTEESSEWHKDLKFIRVFNWEDIPKIILKK